MICAFVYAACSDARLRQVGAIIVKGNRVISIGINGTPTGHPTNVCEEIVDGALITKSVVIHAEDNAIRKLQAGTDSCVGASMFTTHRPCRRCAPLIQAAGITHVYYADECDDRGGLDQLAAGGVSIERIQLSQRSRSLLGSQLSSACQVALTPEGETNA